MNYFIGGESRTNKVLLRTTADNAGIEKLVNDLRLQQVNWLKFQLFRLGLIAIKATQEKQNIPSTARINMMFEDYCKTGHTRADAEEYAILCFRALVEEWDADPAEIDFENIIDGSLGHLLAYEFDEDEPQLTPDEWIQKWLADKTDFGLDNWGLTRAKYEKVLAEVAK